MRGKESKLHLGWHRSWQRDSFARAGYAMAIRPRRKYVHAALSVDCDHIIFHHSTLLNTRVRYLSDVRVPMCWKSHRCFPPKMIYIQTFT